MNEDEEEGGGEEDEEGSEEHEDAEGEEHDEDEGQEEEGEEEGQEEGQEDFSEEEMMEGEKRATHKIFDQLDKDGDHLLSREEFQNFTSTIGIPDQNAANFDEDKDMKLSVSEFQNFAHSVIQNHPDSFPKIRSTYSLAEISEEDLDEEDHEEDLKHGDPEMYSEEDHGDDEDHGGEDLEDFQGLEEDKGGDMSKHFKDADLDGSGALEEQEMQKLLSKMNMKSFDWKTLDTDHDGKLSKQEFTAAMEE